MIPPEDDRQAREFRGFVRLLEELGSSAEHVFSRLYGVLSARDKVVVDSHALDAYKNKAEAIRDRARQQTNEIARLTGILGVLDDGVIMQDPQGRIILMNEAARQMLGSAKNFWQTELGQFFKAGQGAAPVEQQMQVVGKPQRVTLNDRILGVRLAAINSEEGNHLGTVMLLHDASDVSVGERLKDSFIAQISHELRTPLASIKGMSDVLLNTPEGKPPSRKFMEAISRNASLLDRMVVELLDISEISDGSFQIVHEPLELDELAFNVLKGFEPELAKHGLRARGMVVNTQALHIQGDNRRLQWAVGHLVDNAIKYTPNGGQVALRVGKMRGDRVMLQVADSGVGISPKDLPRIFERFYRGEARTPDGKVIDPRGLGQGLYIAQAVIEAHGGYVSVASIPGEGSTFTVELPPG